MRKCIKWEQKEIDYLKWNYPKLNSTEIKKYFPFRTLKSVKRKIQNLGLKYGNRKWTKEEMDYLRKNYGKISSLIISKNLKRTLISVYGRAEKLGLKSEIKTYFTIYKNGYTLEEDEILKKYWATIQTRQIKEKFPTFFKKRTLVGIRRRANRLGLKSTCFSNCKELNGNYKNGKSREPYPLEWSDRLKEFIRNRDKKCAICKMSRNVHKKYYKRDLSVHHIDGNKMNLDPQNLISLCLFHHSKIINIQEELKDYFQVKVFQIV